MAAVKSTIPDPVIYVAGDFNKRDLGPDLELAANLTLMQSGPTRGDSTLDLICTNMQEATAEVCVLPPLDAAGGVLSDHRCIYLASKLGREQRFRWMVRLRRTRNQAREEAFASELEAWDWSGLEGKATVEGMVDRLEAAMAALTDKHFPLVRVRKRSNEGTWITRSIRRLWKKKIRIYKKNGKCEAWWNTDRILQDEISTSKEAFVHRLLEDGGTGRSFYAATRKLAAVTEIYNRINDTGYWPAQWKTEYLTVIPKFPNPSDLSECRNISCTSAFSNILEYQVLAKLRGELVPDDRQYGQAEASWVQLWFKAGSGGSRRSYKEQVREEDLDVVPAQECGLLRAAVAPSLLLLLEGHH